MGSQSASGKIRVAIVGVGNCAASLVQGVHFYRDADPVPPSADAGPMAPPGPPQLLLMAMAP